MANQYAAPCRADSGFMHRSVSAWIVARVRGIPRSRHAVVCDDATGARTISVSARRWGGSASHAYGWNGLLIRPRGMPGSELIRRARVRPAATGGSSSQLAPFAWTGPLR